MFEVHRAGDVLRAILRARVAVRGREVVGGVEDDGFLVVQSRCKRGDGGDGWVGWVGWVGGSVAMIAIYPT
jgi:hypothetical protein